MPKTVLKKPTTAMKQRVYNALRLGYFNDNDDTVEVSNGHGDNLHVTVVSRKFDGKRADEKQNLIISLLMESLPKDWTHVSLAIGMSPEDVNAS